MEGEIVRDIILSASGKLNLDAGGPPFFPAIPRAAREEAARVGKWLLTKEEPATWKRSVYSYWKRARKAPMFEVFDEPDTMTTCERRTVTTVPTQALTLLNDEFVLMQSRYFAERVRQAGADPAGQIESAYRIALGRNPSSKEMADSRQFLEKQRAHHAGKGTPDPALAALTDLVQCDGQPERVHLCPVKCLRAPGFVRLPAAIFYSARAKESAAWRWLICSTRTACWPRPAAKTCPA